MSLFSNLHSTHLALPTGQQTRETPGKWRWWQLCTPVFEKWYGVCITVDQKKTRTPPPPLPTPDASSPTTIRSLHIWLFRPGRQTLETSGELGWQQIRTSVFKSDTKPCITVDHKKSHQGCKTDDVLPDTHTCWVPFQLHTSILMTHLYDVACMDFSSLVVTLRYSFTCNDPVCTILGKKSRGEGGGVIGSPATIQFAPY